jgi:hypothetical protein
MYHTYVCVQPVSMYLKYVSYTYVHICSIHYIHIDIRANVLSIARERDRERRERNGRLSCRQTDTYHKFCVYGSVETIHSQTNLTVTRP